MATGFSEVACTDLMDAGQPDRVNAPVGGPAVAVAGARVLAKIPSMTPPRATTEIPGAYRQPSSVHPKFSRPSTLDVRWRLAVPDQGRRALT